MRLIVLSNITPRFFFVSITLLSTLHLDAVDAGSRVRPPPPSPAENSSRLAGARRRAVERIVACDERSVCSLRLETPHAQTGMLHNLNSLKGLSLPYPPFSSFNNISLYKRDSRYIQSVALVRKERTQSISHSGHKARPHILFTPYIY